MPILSIPQLPSVPAVKDFCELHKSPDYAAFKLSWSYILNRYVNSTEFEYYEQSQSPVNGLGAQNGHLRKQTVTYAPDIANICIVEGILTHFSDSCPATTLIHPENGAENLDIEISQGFAALLFSHVEVLKPKVDRGQYSFLDKVTVLSFLHIRGCAWLIGLL